MTTGTRLAAQALAFIRRHDMARGGDLVLVAVSGGPDSVALLDVLADLAPRLDVRLSVIHVHHGLRDDADRDAEMARAHAERRGLPFHLERVEVRRTPPWEGLEAEARRVRLAALEAHADVIGASHIATGHTADDQAETVLMRLLDGAGPRGLSGIAVTRDRLIRPLLSSRRDDVLAHLRARGLAWVDDASNDDVRIRRNRVRHEVLPYLAGVEGGSVVEALCRSAALNRALVDDFERRARDELDRLATFGPCGAVFDIAELKARSVELAAEILMAAVARLGDARPRRGTVHRAVRRFVTADGPRRGVAMGALVLERSGRHLRAGPKALPPLAPRRWNLREPLALDEVGLALEARRFERPADYLPPRGLDRTAFDADALSEEMLVRPRRRGERFEPFGAPGERRIKSLFADAGVPRWDRARVPVLDASGHTLWVVGVRRGRAAPITASTRRILEVTVRRL